MMKLRDLPPQYGIKGIRSLRGSRAAVMASLTQSFAKRKTVAEMLDIIKRQEPTLSDDNLIENLTVELETRLEKFKNDVAAGRFS
jgi:succinoglycan biosynthesis protein ExoV